MPLMLALGLVLAVGVWLVLSIAAAIYAARLRRTGVGWFFLSLILSPLIVVAFLLALGRRETLFCPYCAEPIREEATRCPYCRGEIGEDEAPRPHPLDRGWEDRTR